MQGPWSHSDLELQFADSLCELIISNIYRLLFWGSDVDNVCRPLVEVETAFKIAIYKSWKSKMEA